MIAKMKLPVALASAVLVACGGSPDVVVPTETATPAPVPGNPTGPTMADVTVTDEGLSSGYQDKFFGTWKRGRGNVVADFDGDGDQDVFSGNPNNQSFLIRNTTAGPGEPLSFEAWQVLSEDALFYGGVAADFDNDGDPDLFVSAGANDGPAFDRFYRNDRNLGAPADAPLVDISDVRRVQPLDAAGVPMQNGTMGARAFDANNDGMLDIWASNEVRNLRELQDLTPEQFTGLNQLYLNGPDLQFENEAWDVGLQSQAGSRHASVFDFDHDGDLDIFENNFTGRSVFWRSRLAQDGVLSYEDITATAPLDGGSLAGPIELQSMCSISADLDNDGWEDMFVLHRGVAEPLPAQAVAGHQVWMNQKGTGFVEVGAHTGINAKWDDRPEMTSSDAMAWWGVMGCQVGDVDLDGFPDVFFGNGGGGAGEVNGLFVSSKRIQVDVPGVGTVTAPVFEDWSPLIDFPPPVADGEPAAPYPNRTHGTAFVDFDGDGVDELGVHNGGPASREMEEPNRLYRFHLPDPRFLRVTLVGDGTSVNRDGVGSRVKVTVQRNSDGAVWDVWKTRHAAIGFGAQNGPQLVFGLADADAVLAIEVTWPDGTVQSPTPPAGTANWLVVER